jgi:outer membrane immunogenic protein
MLAVSAAVAAAALASATIARADGMPAGPAAYAAPFSWTGIYLGVSSGWAEQETHWRYTNPVPSTCCKPFSADADEPVAGAHIGAQYQFGMIVVGAEVGGIMKLAQDHLTKKLGCVATVPGDTCEAEIGNLFTVGPRVGLAWQNWLVYGTGGYAQGYVNTKVMSSPTTTFDTTDEKQRGYFAGGGVEYALSRHVTAGIQYEHVDLGTTFHPSSADGFLPSPPGVNGRNIGATEDIVSARLSFKFGLGRDYAPLK